MKFLGISYENDRHIISSILDLYKDAGHETFRLEASISMVSNFSHVIEKEKSTNLITIEKPVSEFYNSQDTIDTQNDIYELSKLEQTYLSDRKNIRQLMRTAPYFYQDHHSRKPYYNIPFDDSIRLNYIKRLLHHFLSVMSYVKPDLIFCFNGNYLYKQFAADYCRIHNVPFLCIAPSRLKTYMVFLDCKFNSLDVPDSAISGQTIDLADQFMESVASNSTNLTYKGIFDVAAQRQLSGRGYQFMSAFKDFLKYLKFIIPFRIRLYLLSPSRLRKVRKYHFFNSNAIFVFANYFLVFSRQLYLAFRPLHCGVGPHNIKSLLRKCSPNIYYMPLHLLPESATLSQSNYYYEEDLIRLVSSLLPIDSILLVKENPLMVGHRDLDFYRRICSLGNIYLSDITTPTSDILPISSGVIGISGTVLIEAILMNIPVCVLGTPEFLSLVNPRYQGISAIQNFLSDVSAGSYPIDYNIINYIRQIIESGMLTEEGDLSTIYLGGSKKSIMRLSRLFYNKINWALSLRDAYVK